MITNATVTVLNRHERNGVVTFHAEPMRAFWEPRRGAVVSGFGPGRQGGLMEDDEVFIAIPRRPRYLDPMKYAKVRTPSAYWTLAAGYDYVVYGHLRHSILTEEDIKKLKHSQYQMYKLMSASPKFAGSMNLHHWECVAK